MIIAAGIVCSLMMTVHRGKGLLVWWMVMWSLIVLTGCTSRPAPLPEPAPLPAPILCAAPAAMTEHEPMPRAPRGDYTQQEVALYLLALHRWGSRGWQRLAAIHDYTRQCRVREQ
ncbi:hypothetical protein AN401_07185 [Zobellella denitrificans]|uniref:Uncharacterized protein n=1 Tax=Zobellella denitrificans TaxID=347534 RepID=A0A291HN66_9GAMM|nr:hypothetical protein AN401_07185 [Zobellella denitrificans]